MYYFIFDLDDTLYQNTSDIVVDDSKLDKLSKLGKLILFSNATNKHCIEWLEQLKISKYFTVIISSDTFNMYKPNPNLYKRLISNCGILSRDTVFFFDDMQINLYPAWEIGWNTILIKKDFDKTKFYKLNLKNNNYIHNNFDDINIALDYVLFFLEDSNKLINKTNNN